MRVFENDANDHFVEVWASTEQSTPSIVALGTGESDGDDAREIIAGVAGTLGTLYLWENIADNEYVAIPFGYQMDWQVRDIHIGDTDADNAREIIGVGSDSVDGGSLKIWEHVGPVGDNSYVLVHDYDTVSYLLGCEVGDADNDGNGELLLNVGGWAGFPTYIRRLEYNPDIGDWEHKLFEASTTGLPISAEIGDFDMDGDMELAVGSTEVIHIYESLTDDTFTPVWSSSFTIAGNVMDLTLGPLNEFGYPIIASCSFDGQVDFIGYDGETYVRHLATPLNVSGALRSIDCGDFDGGDGALDIFLARSGSNLVSLFEELDLTAADLPFDARDELRLEIAGNPFRTSTELHFSVASPMRSASLHLYDARGRLVRKLFDGITTGSEHILTWDGRDDLGTAMPSGVYLARLAADRSVLSKRIVLLR